MFHPSSIVNTIPRYRVTKKNRTHKNFIESYKDPKNVKHFAGFKLQSVYYNRFPKFQSLKSLHMKVMFIPKYAPNGLHSVEGKLAYVVQNCQCFFAS